jgi:hypothetical protein
LGDLANGNWDDELHHLVIEWYSLDHGDARTTDGDLYAVPLIILQHWLEEPVENVRVLLVRKKTTGVFERTRLAKLVTLGGCSMDVLFHSGNEDPKQGWHAVWQAWYDRLLTNPKHMENHDITLI